MKKSICGANCAECPSQKVCPGGIEIPGTEMILVGISFS